MPCPYLAHPAHPDEAPTAPAMGNSCYAGRADFWDKVPVDTQMQRSLCFHNDFSSCRWLKRGLSTGVSYPTWVTASKKKRSGKKPWWRLFG